MILYFTGTGNSEYVAERIGAETGEKVVNLFQKLRDRDCSELFSETPWVIVTPTYGWRIPRILKEWLEHTPLTGSREIYFVMTCGQNIGNAGKYLKEFCREKKLRYRGCFEIVMPENYIALFRTPTKEEAKTIIKNAEKEIDKTVQLIKNREMQKEPAVTIIDRFSSGMVNELFYPLFVHAKKFYATDGCISCGKCEKACVLKNIRIEDGKPHWGKNCTHCMACICKCPREAIEYGKHSVGLPRYRFPQDM